MPETPPSSTERRPPRERRKWYRYPRTGPTATLLGVAGSPAAVEVENISIGGISFVLARRTAEGQTLTLRLCRPGGDRCAEHGITVTYCFEHPDGYHVVGAAFDRELSEEELRALL